MAQTDQPADRLLVALHGPTALIRVEGRGSFKISATLKEFASAAIDKGSTSLALDMADCVGMDSTFMGVLAGLAIRLRQKANGRIVMVNLSLRTRGLLSTLGLDQVIEPHMTGSTPPEVAAMLPQGQDLAALENKERDMRSTTETMLEAHQNLVRIAPENLPKFKDVLTFLREDLKKSEPEHREGK
jgi:anti-sigma B factor antagonist